MTLKEVINKATMDDEITVVDNEYDVEFYFYGINEDDLEPWNQAFLKIAEALTVLKEFDRGDAHVYIVNMAQALRHAKKMDREKCKDLFIDTRVDAIMDDIEEIMAGGVGENWMVEFADWLLENNKKYDILREKINEIRPVVYKEQ